MVSASVVNVTKMLRECGNLTRQNGIIITRLWPHCLAAAWRIGLPDRSNVTVTSAGAGSTGPSSVLLCGARAAAGV